MSPAPLKGSGKFHLLTYWDHFNELDFLQENLMLLVGSCSDALIRNLHVNTEGPVPQLVLDQSIKMTVAKDCVERKRGDFQTPAA